MKIYIALLLLLVWGTTSRASFPDSQFESSDGKWTSFTCEKKGRDFESVLWHFEAYKFRTDQPNLALYRTTPTPKIYVIRKAKAKRDIKWKVPYRAQSAESIEPPRLSPYTEDEKKQIRERAEAAFQFWSSKRESR